MKRKVTLCVLVFALLLTCANAMAAKIGGVTADDDAATIEADESGKSFKVTYDGQKDKEYVVMVVSDDGIGEGNLPNTDNIKNIEDGTTDGIVVYMDQVKCTASNGKVEFTVRPNLSKAEKDQAYSVYISSNAADSGSAMKKIGSFTSIEELLRYLGDVYRDDNADDITILDVQKLLNYVIENTQLTGDDLKAANVDKDVDNQITILDVQRLLNMVITNAPKESIS